MKVLWIIPRIDPKAGGPSSTAVNAVIAEARKGLDVTLVFTENESSSVDTSPAVKRMEAVGAKVIQFPRTGRSEKAGSWGLSWPLSKWIIRNLGHYDIAHLQYVWAATSVLGILSGALHRTPIVMTPHESLTKYDIDLTSGNRFKRRLKLVSRFFILRGVDALAFSSELERSDSQAPAAISFVIPHAVSENTPLEPLPEPNGSVIVLGFLGRIHPKKNIDLILEALAILEPAQDYRLIAAGTGSLEVEASLRTRAEFLDIANRIEWRGHVDYEQRSSFFREIHILLMPSEYECFGMVAAESMSVGVPAVVSETTGISSLISDFEAGVVLEEMTPDDLASAIQQFVSSPERMPKRVRSLELVDSHLTFSAYSNRSADLYSSLVS